MVAVLVSLQVSGRLSIVQVDTPPHGYFEQLPLLYLTTPAHSLVVQLPILLGPAWYLRCPPTVRCLGVHSA